MTNTASEIVKNVGGARNITSVSHCATRLRFQLKDASGVQAAAVEKIQGVMGAVPQAGSGTRSSSGAPSSSSTTTSWPCPR